MEQQSRSAHTVGLTTRRHRTPSPIYLKALAKFLFNHLVQPAVGYSSRRRPHAQTPGMKRVSDKSLLTPDVGWRGSWFKPVRARTAGETDSACVVWAEVSCFG